MAALVITEYGKGWPGINNHVPFENLELKMGFLFSIDLFLGQKAFWPKKCLKRGFFPILIFTNWKICHSRVFLDLNCLYIDAAIPNRWRLGGEEGDWVFWSFGSLQGSWCRWQDLLQYLEEVGVVTWSFWSMQWLEWQDRLHYLEEVGVEPSL